MKEDIESLIRNKDSRKFFPWKLYFAEVFREKGGFDIVVANPPYIQLQKAINDYSKKSYADIYKDCEYKTFKRSSDMYVLFYEKGIELLKENGIIFDLKGIIPRELKPFRL